MVAEIAASARKTLEGMDPQKVAAFGQVLQENLAKKVIKPPPGVSQGPLQTRDSSGVGVVRKSRQKAIDEDPATREHSPGNAAGNADSKNSAPAHATARE